MNPIIRIFALLLLPCAGCATSNAPAPAPTAASAPADLQQEGEKAQANFEIHEWGVLVGSYTDDTYLNTTRPPEAVIHLLQFDEPIIYVHSKDRKPFSLRVTFASGKPTLTYPVAEVSAQAVFWPLVQFGRPVQKTSTGASSEQEINLVPFMVCTSGREGYEAAPGAGVEDFAPLSELMPALNDVDADELIYKGQTTRFLFYEGDIRYHNTIMLDHTMGEKTATVHNTGSDTVYDVMVVAPPEEGYTRLKTVSVGWVRELKAGEKLSLSLVPLENDVSLAPSLIALGFTAKEAVSFEKVWKGPFLRPAELPGSINLIYRLGQEQCQTITELEFDPKPDKIARAVYLLVRSSSAKTPLQLAVDAGDAERVESLLRSGAPADAKVEYAAMPRLRDSGTNHVPEVRGSILHWAAAQKNVDLVEFLLAHGANVNGTDSEGVTPLHRAAYGNHWETANLLLAHGAVPTAVDRNGDTPLHTAAFTDAKDVAELLLARGVEVDSRNRGGDTPLLVAASRGSIKVAELLLAHGASVNASSSDDDYTPSWVTSPYPTVTQQSIDKARLPLAQAYGYNASRVAGLSGETPLHRAVKYQNIDMAKLLLAHGASVSVQDSAGRTPLSLAIEHRHAEMIELLLAHGADLNVQLRDGLTLLHQAVRRGDLAVIQLLLDHKADVNAKDKQSQTPLDCAQNPQIAGFLLDRGAKLGEKTSGNFTPLLWAFDGKNNALAARLLACGANPNATLWGGLTLLSSAIENKDEELATLLITHGANVNEEDRSGVTPLLEAYAEDNTEIVKLLLAHGADANAKAPDGRILLGCAVDDGRTEVVSALLVHGADPNSRYKDGTTPLYHAIKEPHTEIIKLLLDHHADMYAEDINHDTPLSMAINYGQSEAIDLMLEHGAKADSAIRDYAGAALFSAVINNNRDKVALYLSFGADANAKGKDGSTPLSLVKNPDIAKLLVRHGADPKTPLKDDDNCTYLHSAASIGDKELVELVLAGGADIEAKDRIGKTPLCYAVDDGRTEIVAVLLAHGANPNSRDKDGWTPLHDAVDRHLTENYRRRRAEDAVAAEIGRIIELLLIHHANPDAKDNSGYTPLCYAMSNRDKAAIGLMLKYGAKPDAINRCINGTGIFVAVAMGYRDTVALYLSYGADPNQKDESGTLLDNAANYEPLRDHAAQGRQKEMVKLLLSYGADPKQALFDGRHVFKYWPDLANIVKKREVKPAAP